MDYMDIDMITAMQWERSHSWGPGGNQYVHQAELDARTKAYDREKKSFLSKQAHHSEMFHDMFDAEMEKLDDADLEQEPESDFMPEL